jgi:D-arabinitol 2-dehydrogenase
MLSRLKHLAARPLRPSAVCARPSLARSLRASAVQRKDDGSRSVDSGEGSPARTDSSVQMKYPEEAELPSSSPVPGRGAKHIKRTLPTFSLEERVAVVTGGARGLGLVMAQSLVISGANVAIVDMNSELAVRGWPAC